MASVVKNEEIEGAYHSDAFSLLHLSDVFPANRATSIGSFADCINELSPVE